MFGFRCSMWTGLFLAAISANISAEEKRDGELVSELPSVKVSAADIERWIEQLDAADIAEQQVAFRKLYAAGRDAIPAIAEAGGGKNPDVADRAINILQHFLESPDKVTMMAAKEALEKVADANNAGAEHAEQVLDLMPRNLSDRVDWIIHKLRANRGKVPLSQIFIWNAHCTKFDRTIAITWSRVKNEKNIIVQITKTINGVKTTQSSQVKDVDELKRNSPGAYSAYLECIGSEETFGNDKQVEEKFALYFDAGMPRPKGSAMSPANFQKIEALREVDYFAYVLKGMKSKLERAFDDFAMKELSSENNVYVKRMVAEIKRQAAEFKSELNKVEKSLDASAAAAPATRISSVDITHWIKQLDSDDPFEQEIAGEKLYQSGKVAVPALKRAAARQNSYASFQATIVLARIQQPSLDADLERRKARVDKKLKSERNPDALQSKAFLNAKMERLQQFPKAGDQKTFDDLSGPIKIAGAYNYALIRFFDARDDVTLVLQCRNSLEKGSMAVPVERLSLAKNKEFKALVADLKKVLAKIEKGLE